MGTTGPNLQCEIDQFVAEAQNWCNSLMKLWTSPLQCLAALTGGATTRYRSPKFAFAPATAALGALVLDGPLVSYCQVGNAVSIPKDLVRIVPSLDVQQPGFHLEVNVADVATCPAGVYHSTVTASGGANIVGANNVIDVWIVIP